MIHYSFFEQQCIDIFGEKFTVELLQNGVDFTNANYGGFGLKPTRVAFPNGSTDPWHALGITSKDNISPGNIAVFINGTAHCADMYPSGDADLKSLVEARQQIIDFLQTSLQAD